MHNFPTCLHILADATHSGGGPGSDSGLSTENGSKKARSSPETETGTDNDRDSGRRSQSFEMLSDDEIKKLYNIYEADFKQFHYKFHFRGIEYGRR